MNSTMIKKRKRFSIGAGGSCPPLSFSVSNFVDTFTILDSTSGLFDDIYCKHSIVLKQFIPHLPLLIQQPLQMSLRCLTLSSAVVLYDQL